MDANAQFLSLIGDIAIRFSNLEFIIAQILEVLIDPANEIVGGLITSELPLAKKIEQINKLAHFRLAPHPVEETRVKELTSRVKNLTQDRNLFIHGMWVIGDISQGVIRCLDQRWRAERDGYDWHRMEERHWTIQQLSERSAHITQLIIELQSLLEELKRIELLDSRTHSPQMKER